MYWPGALLEVVLRKDGKGKERCEDVFGGGYGREVEWISVSSRSRTRVFGWKGLRFIDRGVDERVVVEEGGVGGGGRRMRRRERQKDLRESHRKRKRRKWL